MTSSSPTPDPDDDILFRFQQDHEAAEDREAVLRHYCSQYPHLADRFRARADMVSLLGLIGSASEPPPRRLGDCRILGLVGRGGMGEVYEAVQEPLARRVAVKAIRRGRVAPAARERFLREQQVLARLHQTHIVPIYAAGAEGDIHYFVMPFIDGAALHHVVRRAYEVTSGEGKVSTVPTLVNQLAAERRQAPGAAPPDADRPTAATVHHSPGNGATMAAPAVPRDRPLKLSSEYFRSAASCLADAAEAIQHAHDAGYFHRDIKPSNIMVDREGQCWLIDFGLAGLLKESAAGSAPAAEKRPGAGPLTETGIPGTPPYMAPEQLRGKADARSDVWSLGATLYELCTLRPAFFGSPEELRDRITGGQFESFRSLKTNAPADLEAICRKALAVDLGRRYATAAEFAADLRRWLRDEPTCARPAWAGRRVWMWARRNRGWAAAIATWLLLLATAVVLAAGTVVMQQREMKIQEMQSRRQEARVDGWSDDVWALGREAGKIYKDDRLRDQFAAVLAGLDAKHSRGTLRAPTSSLAFDRDGKRLLMGGLDASPAAPAEPGRLWDGTLSDPVASKQVGSSPVAFRADGTPLQLVSQSTPKGWVLLLWNVARQEPVHRFEVPGASGEKPQALGLSADGSAVAAAIPEPDGKGKVLVWNAESGRLLPPIPWKATSLALSPDGQWLAAGDQDGRIAVWSAGKVEPTSSFTAGRMEVHALAFGRDPRLHADGPRWLLASGDAGGSVILWEPGAARPVGYFRGSHHAIYSLAFSPDRMILASAGRAECRLWDLASQQLILTVWRVGDYLSALAFSPDGKTLAVGNNVPPKADPRVRFLDLENGRGVRTLRGLKSQVSRVAFSPDARLVAALSHEWQVAVWDLEAGRLRCVIDAPPGAFADNASLAFSPENRRLAFSAGKAARLWDLDTGKDTRWPLPPGLVDHLAFDPSGQNLFLFRVETTTGQWGLPATNPRVGRFRNLLREKSLEVIKEAGDFPWDVFAASMSLDGRYVAVAGTPDEHRKGQALKVYEAATGGQVWTRPLTWKADPPECAIDPTGGFLAAVFNDNPNGPEPVELVDLTTGSVLSSRVRERPIALSPRAEMWATRENAPGKLGVTLWPRDGVTPLVRVGIGTEGSNNAVFSATGSLIAWGNNDGTVMVCDIAEVRKRLTSVGLGW